MAMISSSSLTTRPPTRRPLSSESFIALMPSPPRPCTRYSLTAVRFAYPPSVTVNTKRSSVSISESMIAMLNSSSSPRNRIPMTPDVARPIGRNCWSSAANRIACPLALMSSTSSDAEQVAAPISSSSSSRKLIAIRPAWRGESYAVSSLFFTSPRLVASSR